MVKDFGIKTMAKLEVTTVYPFMELSRKAQGKVLRQYKLDMRKSTGRKLADMAAMSALSRSGLRFTITGELYTE
jgi:hypothetical protein